VAIAAVAATAGKQFHPSCLFACSTYHARRPEQGNNPGNNLHVSGLTSKVETRDLEEAFAKCGRVRVPPRARVEAR
jgi:hypothetical protein